MRFDTVIIGGGLSGLICGIYLSRQGQRCVIVSSGQSALHFSSGSFDLLNFLPDGRKVISPVDGVRELIKLNPLHPYVKLGVAQFENLVGKAECFLREIGVQVFGNGTRNHFRITPMGELRSTWLTLEGFVASDNEERLPWKEVDIFNIVGFLDFYSQFIADEFQSLGTSCHLHAISLPALDCLRKNPTEMRSVNIARVFDKRENLEALVRLIKATGGSGEVILLPAVAGLKENGVLAYLRQQLNKDVCLLPTLPPSVPGIRVQQYLRYCFQQAGGVYMLGDIVLKAKINGERVEFVYSLNHENIPFSGDHVVLATGSYFSQGLVADPNSVREPIFDLDVLFHQDRGVWYDRDVFARQAYESFGVKTDSCFRGLYKGKVLENLYVTGAVLGGFDAIKEGCGAGISILSALHVAEQILSKSKKL